MKRLLGLLPLALGVAFASGQAEAADYTASVVPVATWSGFYGAIGAGGEWGDFDFCIDKHKHHHKKKKYEIETYTDEEHKDDGKCDNKAKHEDDKKELSKEYGDHHDPFRGGDDSRFFGTVQLGVNHQFDGSPLVIGAFVSADFGSDLEVDSNNKHHDLVKESLFLFPDDVWKASIGSIFTAGGRVGIAPSDKVLLYGLIGWSWADADISHSLNCPGTDLKVLVPHCHGFNDKNSDTLDGLTFGAGGEFRVSEHVSLGVEWRHINFGSIKLNGDDGGAAPALLEIGDHGHGNGSADVTVDSVRGLLIYHF